MERQGDKASPRASSRPRFIAEAQPQHHPGTGQTERESHPHADQSPAQHKTAKICRTDIVREAEQIIRVGLGQPSASVQIHNTFRTKRKSAQKAEEQNKAGILRITERL